MIGMIASVVFGVLFGHLMRLGQRRGCNMDWVGGVNYAVGAVIAGFWWIAGPAETLRWQAPAIGLLAGLALVAGYFTLELSIRFAGVGIAQAAGRLSAVLPVAVAILFWRETPGLVRWAGLILTLVALPLLSGTHVVNGGAPHRWKAPSLFAYFLSMGTFGIFMKLYTMQFPGGREEVLIFFVFLAATVVNCLVAAVRSGIPGREDIVLGLALGLANICSLYGFARALSQLEGTIVFPSTAVGGILLAAVTAAIIWKERYHWRAVTGMGLAIVSLILINW